MNSGFKNERISSAKLSGERLTHFALSTPCAYLQNDTYKQTTRTHAQNQVHNCFTHTPICFTTLKQSCVVLCFLKGFLEVFLVFLSIVTPEEGAISIGTCWGVCGNLNIEL
jgi:hypothetical protein